MSMKKINVIGTSGTGKSTFSAALAEKLGCEYIELDAIFWQDDWQETPDDELFAKLTERLSQPAWVLDGNYTRTIPIKWREADTVIWLNYGFFTVLFRAIKRAITRIVSKQKLWDTNNTETLGRLFSKDSIVWWTIKTHGKRNHQYYDAMNNPAYAHIKFIELTSPKAANAFLETLSSK